MNKDQRQKYLKGLASSNEGEALKEHFEELIAKMIDATTYDKKNFEKE